MYLPIRNSRDLFRLYCLRAANLNGPLPVTSPIAVMKGNKECVYVPCWRARST
jgi:hypothetical protein